MTTIATSLLSRSVARNLRITDRSKGVPDRRHTRKSVDLAPRT
jgi:hypothetical protein